MAEEASSPEIRDIAVGLDATGVRVEHDSLGAVDVPAHRYWGAQTQRSLLHFAIGDEQMPVEVYRAYGWIKKAAAIANGSAGRLPAWKATLIARVCDEVAAGELDDHFPLSLWQTGSGTQTNMNVNEVVANRCIQLLGGELGSQAPVHPNDDVNMGQSSNDTFPTAMHIATVEALTSALLPELDRLRAELDVKAVEWAGVVKIGRTHLQDAVPMTVGQEWSAYAAQVADAAAEVRHSLVGVSRLAMGGTAVGTGLNAPPGFATDVASLLAEMTGQPYVTDPNKFAALASSDDMVRVSAALRGVAVALYKLANDVRWLASGPRAGLHELELPENEPGSSIMPGKVNPTQAEALLMVAVQVMGLDTAVAMAGAQGNLQLHTLRPLIVGDVLRMIGLLADAADHFRRHLLDGMQLDRARIERYVQDSVMAVTALTPLIGYDRAAKIAQLAIAEDLTLRDAALRSGFVSASDFDAIVVPADLARSPDE